MLLKPNEYLALDLRGKLVHPTNGGPYITKNPNSYLFKSLEYDKKAYKQVTIVLDSIKGYTVLDQRPNTLEWFKSFRKRA